jgi:hypothetical protein
VHGLELRFSRTIFQSSASFFGLKSARRHHGELELASITFLRMSVAVSTQISISPVPRRRGILVRAAHAIGLIWRPFLREMRAVLSVPFHVLYETRPLFLLLQADFACLASLPRPRDGGIRPVAFAHSTPWITSRRARRRLSPWRRKGGNPFSVGGGGKETARPRIAAPRMSAQLVYTNYWRRHSCPGGGREVAVAARPYQSLIGGADSLARYW